PQPVRPISPRCPSNGWINNGGWVDGGINPPHFYLTHEECQHALYYHTGMTEHPRMPEIQRSRIREPAAPVTQPPALPIVINAIALDLPVGHLVSILMNFSLHAQGPVTRGSKVIKKKSKLIKSDYIVLEGITRIDFITAYLSIHGLSDQFSPGVHSGPPFKLYWTGSVGGKGGATTIDNDHQFSVAMGALMKKNRTRCQAGVEFDVDEMDGYRIRNGVRPVLAPDLNNDEDELVLGTQVPQAAHFSEQDQLHGAIILQLKKKWPCAQHQGEHGDVGFCYVSANATHIGLNNRKLKIWAAAIAAADATKHEPPSTIDFDGVRDGHLLASKPRGRHGPYGQAVSAPSSNDATTLLMAAMLPLLTNLSQKRTRSVSSTPPRRSRQRMEIPALSPLPAAGSELHTCLCDFAEASGIDIMICEDTLMALELTPDVIPDVPVARLCELTDIVEGRIRKFQAYCKTWNARLDLKKAEKRQRI
ncbi:hypothetical protein CY34DRAFT_68804, partial [Suillus luteus UH-Slu-Lm8-n1]